MVTDPVEIRRRARPLLEARQDVLAAYLYGSVARGEVGPRSDIDIGVLLQSAPISLMALPFDLEEALSECLEGSVQLLVMNQAPPDLVHRVLRDGVLLMDKDTNARIAFEVRRRAAYLDLRPHLLAYRSG